ncbi:MAG TPA: hypothetical protein VG756_00500 [Pseudonocardiaceae bacterium]|jgi:hypothetical protein|nr:hypothetical protein [Pseudonocardiaceae bacterium]
MTTTSVTPIFDELMQQLGLEWPAEMSIDAPTETAQPAAAPDISAPPLSG